MEKRIMEAAVRGDASLLHQLSDEDWLLVDGVSFSSFSKTPLHIAAMKGHVDFVRILLNKNSDLAAEVDSRRSTPLHLACSKGHLNIVRLLLSANADMCLARDSDGKNPFHLAAMKGGVDVLNELIGAKTVAATERVDRGETILHLCVKHNQLKALMMLVETLNDSEIINAKDDDGNTILHLAVKSNLKLEIVKYLVDEAKIEVNAKNAKGKTALDILQRSQTDPENSDIAIFLQAAGKNSKSDNTEGDWLSRKRDAIMVVASLIATMAYQAGVNPPGGVWQDDATDQQGNQPGYPHTAGQSVMSHYHPKYYRNFVRANTVAFVTSLSTILLLISGLPFKRHLIMWFLMVIMWMAITTTALTYGISIMAVTPEKFESSLSDVINIAVTAWCCVMALLLLGNTIRLMDRWLLKCGINIKSMRKISARSAFVNHC